MIPSFAGKTVLSIGLEYALKIWTTDNWELDLNGDATFLHAGGVQVIDSGVPQPVLPPALAALVGAEITEVLIAKEGHLAVNFATAQLSVRASDDYEAWELFGPRGQGMVCLRGGELAVSPPRAE